MLSIQLLVLGTFVLYNIPMVNSIICYQCTQCPEPFNSNYPYVTLVNNTNFLAICTKQVVNLDANTRLVSKGTMFSCPAETSTGDIDIYCCSSDYCNSSIHFGPSIILLLFIFIRIYL